MCADIFEIEPFSNDATKKILGFEFQKLIALEICLNASPHDILYIEGYGDLAISDISMEVKHHEVKNNMPLQSPDFWKTLKNYVQEKEKLEQFTQIFLYTTSIITRKSPFFSWNEKTKEAKFDLIVSIRENPNESIQAFANTVFNFNSHYQKEELLEILEKFSIIHSQKTIFEKYNDIINDRIFFSLDEKDKIKIVEYLHGKISLKPIKDRILWEIIISDFQNDCRSIIRRFVQNEIPFPDINVDVQYTGNEEYRFITELKKIELQDEIQNAFIDYIRAENTSLELIKRGANLIEKSINDFEKELLGQINNQKKIHALNLSRLNLSTPTSIKESKKLYFNCRSLNKLKIRDVQEIQSYYQYGKMHKIVNDEINEFVWLFLEKDIQ